MSARGGARLLPLLAAPLLLGGCGGGGSDPGMPNVLLVVMDTTRWDRCSVNGYGRPTTPGLEEFAEGAVLYRNAWSPSSWTAPAHASMFTGLRADRHGLTEEVRPYLADDAVTLAERLRDAGWRTGAFADNQNVGADVGLAQGFEVFEAVWKERELPLPRARETHRRALEFMRSARAAGRPFFAFVNDLEPHVPYDPPVEDARRFLPGDARPETVAMARTFTFPATMGYILGEVRLTPRELAVLSDLYDAEVRSLDAEVGRLLAQAEAEGLLENTVVVVCSDHGENLGDHGYMEHSFTLYATLLRVPLLVRVPAAVSAAFPAGTEVDDVVRLEDLYPTLLELCGRSVPADLDGESLARPLGGRVARAQFGPPLRYEEQAREVFPRADLSIFRRRLASVFDGRLHLIRDSDGGEELYDLAADPGETTDLARERPGEAARLRALLER